MRSALLIASGQAVITFSIARHFPVSACILQGPPSPRPSSGGDLQALERQCYTSLMDQNRALRDQLVEMLTGENAHANFEASIDGVPPEKRGVRPDGSPH